MTGPDPGSKWPSQRYQPTLDVELTTRQAEGIVAAHAVGWYKGPPREGRMCDAADLLDLTTGPASRRIRGAEIIVMSDFIERVDLPETPVDPSTAELRRIADSVGAVSEGSR